MAQPTPAVRKSWSGMAGMLGAVDVQVMHVRSLEAKMPKENEQNFLSVSEFAKKEGVTSQAIRKAIKDKRLWAEKVGNSWIIGKEQTLKSHEKFDPFRNRY